MTIRLKIIIILAILLVIILLTVLVIVPNISSSTKNSAAIVKEKEDNITLKNRLNELLIIRDEYYLLNAEYRKYSLQLPSENDISIFTNEIYDIAQYSDVDVRSISFSEQSVTEEDEKLGLSTINASLIIEGSYYNIMNLLSAMERMPRIVKVANIVLQSTTDNYESINAYMTIKLYYRI